MSKEKKFDAVQMMRSIREKVQQEWEANPELMEKRLKEIRKKFKIPEQKLSQTASESAA